MKLLEKNIWVNTINSYGPALDADTEQSSTHANCCINRHTGTDIACCERYCQQLTAISYSLKTNAKHNLFRCDDLKENDKQTLKRARSKVELFMDKFFNEQKLLEKYW